MPIDEAGNFLQPDRIKARQGPISPWSRTGREPYGRGAQAGGKIAASLIPFLEHDDASRALMGSNMVARLCLWCLRAPIVSTGIEKDMISDSRIQIVAEGDGLRSFFADATKIQIKYERTDDEVLASFAPEVTTYELPRYRRTNQNTSVTAKPTVLTGDKVKKGQIITEGYSTERGELALGHRNLKVAFMPWKGYNFEDAIVISERIQREDIFTSVHVDEYIMEECATPSARCRRADVRYPQRLGRRHQVWMPTVSSVSAPTSTRATSS